MSKTSPPSAASPSTTNPFNPAPPSPPTSAPEPTTASPRIPRPIAPDPCDAFATPITSAEAKELELSPAQFMAIDLMLQGNTMVAAAKSAGVTRKTLYRWLHHDPKFQAAYNAWQLDAITSARSRLLAMTDDAVNTLGASVKSDGRLAFALLKSLGTLDRPTPGSTDPDEVAQRMKIEQRESESESEESDFLSVTGEFGIPKPRKK